MSVLEVSNISKSYSRSRKKRQTPFKLTVDSFKIESGNFSAILGPNGSGKTTFLKIILDLLFADQGSARLLGIDHKQKKSRADVGYLPERFSFPKNFTVRQMLEAFGSIDNKEITEVRKRIHSLGKAFEVGYLDEKIKDLSKGMTQTAALMQTLLGNHRLYILDEPFSGLDAVQKKAVMQYLLQLKNKQQVSLLITTHILSDIEKLCDTIHLIQFGTIISSAAKAEILQEFGTVEEYYLNYFESKNAALS